jgi:hypothetical protein
VLATGSGQHADNTLQEIDFKIGRLLAHVTRNCIYLREGRLIRH